MMFTKQDSENNRNVKTQMIVSADNSKQGVCGGKVWSSEGYFKDQVTGYSMEKINFPENRLFYINQTLLTIQKGQKIFCGDHFILSQAIKVANVPVDFENYMCGPEEVKMYQLSYQIATENTMGVYKTIGLINVRGDNSEGSFNYGYCNKKSKLLYSLQKRRIQNSFSGTA